MLTNLVSIINHSEIWRSRQVLVNLVRQYLVLKYRRTFLGFIWTLVSPLLNMFISSFVFSIIMRYDLRDFAVFIFAGMIPWAFFSNSINAGCSSILSNENIIKRIYIPKIIFPIANVTGCLIDTLFSMVALFILALIVGAKLSFALFFLIIALIMIYLFCIGLGLVFSVVNVYFRDIGYIITIALQAGFYLTPILYPVSRFPEKYHWIFAINPMYYFVELFRYPIVHNSLPPENILYTSMFLVISTLLIGIMLFKSQEETIIYRL